MNRIRTGDDVIVIAGKDKGRRGAVVSMGDGERILVEGINLAKKHVKPNPNSGEAGGIQDKEMPIHISNLALFNAQTGKADRVGFRVEEKGDKSEKIRYFKSTGEPVEI